MTHIDNENACIHGQVSTNSTAVGMRRFDAATFHCESESYKQQLKAVIMTRTRAEEPMIQLKGCDTYEYHRIISTRREYHMAVRIGMN